MFQIPIQICKAMNLQDINNAVAPLLTWAGNIAEKIAD